MNDDLDLKYCQDGFSFDNIKLTAEHYFYLRFVKNIPLNAIPRNIFQREKDFFDLVACGEAPQILKTRKDEIIVHKPVSAGKTYKKI